MPRIRCHYDDCVFLEEGYCGAAAIELDPESGCMTYQRDKAETSSEEEWEEEELEELEEDEEEGLYEEEEEDLWDEDDDDDDR